VQLGAYFVLETEIAMFNDAPRHVRELERLWKTFEKLFGEVPDFSDVIIPPRPRGLGSMRLIVVPREIIVWTSSRPLQGTMEVLKKHFPVWQYVSDLDEAIARSACLQRTDSYALWVKNVREASDAPGGISTNSGINILERMLLEGDYFFEHRRHLDVENVTLCESSTDKDGNMVNADWYEGKFCITHSVSTSKDETLRARDVFF
jgi:hypothetical protein